jgi:hypothetical protein
MLTVVLVAAAFVAGLTGAWSPCGFSMVSTLGEHARGRAATLAACAAFVPGALLGGVITFGGLALAGSLLGGGDLALAAAAVVATAAALAELAGVRIAPQIRRQVPEHWRRVLPLPLAAAGYGVLLGLGFTTFVLTFAVWALAGVSLAVGDLSTGALVGLAFGAGRSVPVVALAPFAQRPFGWRATELMAERPVILRGFRAADALALAAVALALGSESAWAQAPAVVAPSGTDPSASGSDVAWQIPGGPGVLARPAGTAAMPVTRPAVGGPYLAAIAGGEIRVADRSTGTQVLALPAGRADQLAVSERWLVLRRTGTRDQIVAVPLAGGPERIVAQAAPAQLGRPALDGDRLVFHVAGRRESRIDLVDLAAGRRQTLKRSNRSQLANPSVLGLDLLWVETTPFSQSVKVMPTDASARARILLRIAPAITADKGWSTDHGPHRRTIRPERPPKTGPRGTTTTLWTTALAADAAYVTRLSARGRTTRAEILRLAR